MPFTAISTLLHHDSCHLHQKSDLEFAAAAQTLPFMRPVGRRLSQRHRDSTRGVRTRGAGRVNERLFAETLRERGDASPHRR